MTGRGATLYRPTWWVRWCLPCDDNDHARCASYDPTYDCDCAGEGHPDLVPRTHVCTPHCDDERGHYPAPGREATVCPRCGLPLPLVAPHYPCVPGSSPPARKTT